MLRSVQEQIIKEFQEIKETTLISGGEYVEWAKSWLKKNGFDFVETQIECSTVLKICGNS